MKRRNYKIRLMILCVISSMVLSIIFLGCGKETENKYDNYKAGILKNLTGLDGCGWIIQLSDSTKLEPINLDDFAIELKENKSVFIQYHERNDLGSYCMVGTVVEIESIE